MGIGSDNTVEFFGGVLGLRPWTFTSDTGHSITLTGIQNEAISDLVIECGELAGDYFWPDSTSCSDASYNLCKQPYSTGLVAHVLDTCRRGIEVMSAMDPIDDGVSPWDPDFVTVHHDAVLASLILNDMMRHGDPSKAHFADRNIGGCHGVEMAEAVFFRILKKDLSNRDHVLILHGVAGHMGRWTLPAPYAPANIADPEARLLATMVHLANGAIRMNKAVTSELVLDVRPPSRHQFSKRNSSKTIFTVAA